MTYGVRTWNASGVLEMDTDSFTYQVIHNQLYRLGAQNDGLVISVSIPGFTTTTCVAMVLPTQPAASDYALHAMPYVSVAPGVVTVRARHPAQPNGTDAYVTAIQFRVIVMRYRN